MDSEAPASLRFYNLLGQIDAHRRKIAVALIALAVVLLAVSVLKWRKQEAENAANRDPNAHTRVVRGHDHTDCWHGASSDWKCLGANEAESDAAGVDQCYATARCGIVSI